MLFKCGHEFEFKSAARSVGLPARPRRGPGWLFGAGRQYHPVPVSFSLEMGGVSQLDSNFPICKLCSAYTIHTKGALYLEKLRNGLAIRSK